MSPHPTTQLPLCLCGCNRQVAKPGNRYLLGHSHIPHYPPVEERLRAQTQFGEGDACDTFIGHHDKRGYGRIVYNGKQQLAHRVAWELANGPIQPGKNACHKCDNPSCVKVSHLFIGDQRDNALDMMSKGRGRYITHPGETHGMSKLNDNLVREIRQRAINTKHTILAADYSVTPATIGYVVRRVTWKHVA